MMAGAIFLFFHEIGPPTTKIMGNHLSVGVASSAIVSFRRIGS